MMGERRTDLGAGINLMESKTVPSNILAPGENKKIDSLLRYDPANLIIVK
jgi:hypothetical protein